MTLNERVDEIGHDQRTWAFGCTSPFLALSLPGAWLWWSDAAHSGWPVSKVAVAVVPTLFSIMFIKGLLDDLYRPRPVRLVPFFSERMGLDFDLFRSGEEIVRCFGELELVAEGVGVTKLSEFASGPRWYGRPPEWYDPAHALATVRQLRSVTESRSHPGSDRAALVEEFAALETALSRAVEIGAGFAFHLRSRDSAISPMEMDQLPGFYW